MTVVLQRQVAPPIPHYRFVGVFAKSAALFVSLFPVIGIQYPVFITIDTDADSRAGRDTGERDFSLICPGQSDELGEGHGGVPNTVGTEKSGPLVYETASIPLGNHVTLTLRGPI